MIPTRDQIEGMFFGIAISDALGMPAKNLPIEEKEQKYGRIISYVRPDGHKWFDGREAGTWTDDTQLTLLVADSLIECKEINLDDLAKHHIEYWQKEGDLGFGPTTRAAIKKLASGVHWSKSGKSNNPKHGFGNAMPMKVGPIGALRTSLFWNEQWIEWRSEFIKNIIRFTLMTHYTRMAIDSALTHVFAVNLCLENNFSVKNFITRILYWSEFILYEETHQIKDRISQRFEQLGKLNFESLTPEKIIELFGGGTSYVYNSLPFSYAFFLRNPYSIETLYDVVNSGGDTDTNSSIIGGLLGALNGVAIFPRHLIDGLWQKERIKATSDRFYETFFERRKETRP